MLPSKRERKLSVWQAFKGFSSTAGTNSEFKDNHNELINPFDTYCGRIPKSIAEQINKPILKRKRAFTGNFNTSRAGLPLYYKGKDKLLILGVLIFILVDLLLIVMFFTGVLNK